VLSSRGIIYPVVLEVESKETGKETPSRHIATLLSYQMTFFFFVVLGFELTLARQAFCHLSHSVSPFL
jgi:hypothetical protein